MASYKIYFLNFCQKNWSSRNEYCLVGLQNATDKADFMKKRVSRRCPTVLSVRFDPYSVEHFVFYQWVTATPGRCPTTAD